MPQVMAMATLGDVFRNPKVFSGVVKLRKGLAARMVLACCSSSTVAESRAAYREWFGVSAAKIKAKAVAALTLVKIQQQEAATAVDAATAIDRLDVLRRIVASCDAITVRIHANTVAEKRKTDAVAMDEDRMQNTTTASPYESYTPIISPVAVLQARIPVSIALLASCCYVLLAPITSAL